MTIEKVLDGNFILEYQAVALNYRTEVRLGMNSVF